MAKLDNYPQSPQSPNCRHCGKKFGEECVFSRNMHHVTRDHVEYYAICERCDSGKDENSPRKEEVYTITASYKSVYKDGYFGKKWEVEEMVVKIDLSGDFIEFNTKGEVVSKNVEKYSELYYKLLDFYIALFEN